MATTQEGDLCTTKVRNIRYNDDGTVEFKTNNSIYLLEAEYEAS